MHKDLDQHENIEVGLITGIGQSEPLEHLRTIEIATPYGSTSTPIRIGTAGGRPVAVIARRGDREQIPPHLVPHRANIWALAALGVRALVTTPASTGLHDAFSPGTYVVPDDLIDYTSGRATTFFEDEAVQVASVEPFDQILRSRAVEALVAQKVRVRDFGTIAVIEGPRFPTRAETRRYASDGAHLANMTAMPETILARELGIGVVNVSLITDHAGPAAAEHGHHSALELIRIRAAQSQRTLLQALDALASDLVEHRSAHPIPDTVRAAVLARPALHSISTVQAAQ